MGQISKTSDGVTDFFLGRSAAFPAFDGGVFVWLEQLVDLEKVAHFIKKVLRQVFNINIWIHAWVI